ncbi:MAG: histidine--tRNA ligase [Bacillota bacterium]|nr:histidine--tRNA ligase [Bacillota bacterium]
MQIKAPRGTYDILPAESCRWQYIEKVLADTAEVFGFQEIRFPIFEHTELFERGVGETTDIVSKEMYTFQDKGGRSVTLRPEGTASCTRALIEHSVYGGVMPVKWYYSGPMFRYDRPAAGRYRQFHQFGVEAFGSQSPYLDIEIISLLVQILTNLGLKDYELHLNSVGCPQCREIYRNKLVEHIRPVRDQLCKDCQNRFEKNPLRVLDCKNASCHEAIKGYPVIYDSLCEACRTHYNVVQNGLDELDIPYIHDNNLVRGLDYYTNTAFEINLPHIGSAVGGGGRYNDLVQECGGPDLPGIGFAIGMERLLLALAQQEAELQPAKSVFVAVFDPEFEMDGQKVLQQLRQNGIMANRDYTGRSAKAQMKYADKLGARVVLLLGRDEIEQGIFTLRDMNSKEQFSVESEDLMQTIKKILA